MRVSPAALRGLVPALLSVLLVPPALAGPADHKYLNVHGRVVDGSGAPIADVRLEARGSREAIALTDADGRYALALDLGTLESLHQRPFAVWIHGSAEGRWVRIAGGEPSLAIEVSVLDRGGVPQLQARSNFGLIADAVLGALAPPGERTAVIQARFISEPGADPDTTVALLAVSRVAVLDEPWLLAPPPAPDKRAPAPSAHGTPTPAAAAPAKHGKPPAQVSAPAPAKTSTPAPAQASAPKPAPAVSPRDSIRLARAVELQVRIAAAQAERDSVWRARRAVSLAHKATTDSLRAIRDAVEDSIRRASLKSASRPPLAAGAGVAGSAKPATTEVAAKPSSVSSSKKSGSAKSPDPPARAANPAPAAQPSSRPAQPVSRGGMPHAIPLGLQRVQPGALGDSLPLSENAASTEFEDSGCACPVRGTVELEFHHLLASPMRVEVSVTGTALRDTVELFMGSPREFHFPRVPCGTRSFLVRPFSQRTFAVITPAEIAPFECQGGELRQLRIVLEPR